MSSGKNTKIIWLEEGLRMLEKEGPGMISIDALAFRTGKTKGSFYHHFKDRDDYVRRLLEYYEKITTLDVIDEAEGSGDPRAGLKKLTELSFRLSSDLELAIRAWALYEPIVKRFQDKLDKRRLSFLEKLHHGAGESMRTARISALRDYSMYIGLQQLKEHFAKMGFQETIREVFNQRG